NSTASQTLNYANIAVDILRDLARASHIPFLQNAAAAISCVLDEIIGTKTNQRMLSRIVKLIHQLTCAVIHLCLVEQGVLPIKILDSIGHFVKTLQRIQTSVQFQQELGKIKRLFRQHEIGGQLRAYEVELQTILNTFKIQNGTTLATHLVELELDAQQRHHELMALLAAREDGNPSKYPNSVVQGSNSSSIFSVLPPVPKFLHGREMELTQIATALQIQPAHLAILGPGGMGKRPLQLPHCITRKSCRNTNNDILSPANRRSRVAGLSISLSLIFALSLQSIFSTAIITHFCNCGTTLLVLDNLETVWEEVESRAEVEELLSLLSEVPTLSLLITMRGAERPAKVKWTRPFLPPLEPLHPSASRQTFIEIADLPPSEEESALEELLALSGNLPLAVSLMATVASYEGYSNTLRRWKIESTALLSEGHDKRSNLETSIALSLSSPRMLSSPNAKNLLILLSFLPDGLSEVDMLSRDALDIPNILKCREALVRTSLAYVDQGRLKALTPIRQYMKSVYPPPLEAVERLHRHWDTLLTLWRSHKELPEKRELMRSILSLDLFSQNVLKGSSPSGDRRLHWKYICYSLDRGVKFYKQEGDSSARHDFYEFAARYHFLSGSLPKALQFWSLG
ncbi:hypothetical protein B0H14DRAFT_2997857, partial [Mycena olivaceomarginata]